MSLAKPKETARSGLANALGRYRVALTGVFLLSALVNILMLTGPLFMLQVYDRVLPSGSIPTLIALAILVIALFSFQGILDAVRARVLHRIGSSINESLIGRVYDVVLRLPLSGRGGRNGLQPIRDLDQIHRFLASPGPSALFDLPWIPFYILICFLFHPWIGINAAVGALVLAGLTLWVEFSTRAPAKEAVDLTAARYALLEAGHRNAEVVHAMGMGPRFSAQLNEVNGNFLRSQHNAADRAGMLAAATRVLRLMIQSGVLGLGAYLVIMQEATAGIIIASSILVGRALAPVELAIANWKGFVGARQARARLHELLEALPEREQTLPLPKPDSSLSVENVTAAPPGTQKVVLQDVNFTLKGGQGLGVIGPSASGKSTLARLIVGVWQPVRGNVRLDGAALDQWAPEVLGQHIGYLPQSVELFNGTVAKNISRFEVDPEPEAVIAAAKAAGVHELIVNLSDGYDTDIGEAGSNLSAGQRQRVALARALYRDPFLVVLDEPNSNLDADGEEALVTAIKGVRARGGIAIIVAHRPSVLAAVDQVLVLKQGVPQNFGPRDDVLRSILKPAPVAQPLTVVAGAKAATS